RCVQLGVRDRQPGLRHRQLRIEPQRLVERARRLEPDVGMQMREPLIVKSLRLFRRCRDLIVGGSNSFAKRDRTLRGGKYEVCSLKYDVGAAYIVLRTSYFV